MSLVIFLFSPLSWFHGTVALTYIVEAFFSALVGYLCWRVYSGKRPLRFLRRSHLGWRQASDLRPR